MPMAVYSFLDEYDLSGKTIVPFVTSGGSGFSGSVSEIESASRTPKCWKACRWAIPRPLTHRAILKNGWKSLGIR